MILTDKDAALILAEVMDAIVKLNNGDLTIGEALLQIHCEIGNYESELIELVDKQTVSKGIVK